MEITKDKAVKVLAANGKAVTPDQAGVILEFMYKLATVALKNEDSRLIYKGEYRRAS